MNQLVPLILIWMFANRATSSQASLTRGSSTSPKWPTPNSPPPPMPAFDAIRTDPYTTPMSADPSHVSTPLAELHNAPPEVQPASTSIPDTIKKQAQHAFQRKASAALAKASPAKHTAPLRKKAMSAATKAANQSVRNFAVKHALSTPTQGPTLQNTAATTQAVSKLQQILNQRGAKLKQDGLFGPKTASAWKAAAKSKGLPDTIARVNSKTAKVVARTYDSLSIP